MRTLTDQAAPAYDALAPFYDEFTSHHDYEGWIGALEQLARAHGLRGRRVLDVACGTGKSCAPFAARGYAITGCDASQAMLDRACVRVPCARLLRRDLRRLGRLGTFDLVCCIDDGLNYLLTEDELAAALHGMAAQLTPGGLVLFDVNTLCTYRTFFAGTARTDHVRWQGHATPAFAAGGLAEATVDIVGEDGARLRTVHRQRHHPPAAIDRALAAAGLELAARRGQDLTGRIEPQLDERRHTKALHIARRS
jgi:SAM-dependent methyltransferase